MKYISVIFFLFLNIPVVNAASDATVDIKNLFEELSYSLNNHDLGVATDHFSERG